MELHTEYRNLVNMLKTRNIVDKNYEIDYYSYEQRLVSLFNPGFFYYFILNLFDMTFDYVHPDVEKIYGCDAQDFTLNTIFNSMDEFNRTSFVKKENAVADFFIDYLSPPLRLKYKSSYTLKIENLNKKEITLLHQALPIQLTDDGMISKAISVHTDISYLHPSHSDSVSFIGLEGEPSFINHYSIKKDIAHLKSEYRLTSSELKIIKQISNGQLSKNIAAEMGLSVHTVETHRRKILEKLSANNIAEVVTRCYQLGLI